MARRCSESEGIIHWQSLAAGGVRADLDGRRRRRRRCARISQSATRRRSPSTYVPACSVDRLGSIRVASHILPAVPIMSQRRPEERQRHIDGGSDASPCCGSAVAAGSVLGDDGRHVDAAAGASDTNSGRPERNDEDGGMKPAELPAAAAAAPITRRRGAAVADPGRRAVGVSRAYQFRKAKSAATFMLDGVSYTIGKYRPTELYDRGVARNLIWVGINVN